MNQRCKYYSFLFLFSVFLALSLCGCQGLSAKSPNQRSVAQTMALDLSSDRETPFQLTLRVLDAEGSPEGPETFQTVQAQGKSITDALGDISRQLGKDIFLRDVRVILLGESLCRNGIDTCQNFMSQSYQIRPRVSVAAASGEASRFLQDNENGEAPVDELISLLEWDSRPGNSAVTVMELERVRSASEGDCMLPYISWGEEEGKAEIDGAAVFTGGKLSSKLSRKAAEELRFIAADPRQAVLTVPLSSGGNATFRLTGRKGRIHGGTQDNAPLFTVKFCYEFQLLEFTGGGEIPTLDVMESALEDSIRQSMSDSIQEVVFSGDADIMGLASAMRRDAAPWWNQFGGVWRKQPSTEETDNLFLKSVFVLDISCKVIQSDIRLPLARN